MSRASPSLRSGFTLLEVILALAIFVAAAVALAGAMNTIGLSVVESSYQARVRGQLRSHLVETSRDPGLRPGRTDSLIDGDGVFYRIDVERFEATNEEGTPLERIFEVRVTAIRQAANGREQIIDQASTLTYPGIF